MKKRFLFFLAALILCSAPLQAYDITLGASSSSAGLQQSIVNRSGLNYLKFEAVDQNLNRIRITDAGGKIYFDSKPSASQVIYLPPGTYSAVLWSGYGHELSSAVAGDFIGAPPAAPAQQTETKAAPAAENTGGYGYPPYYYYNYNYGYGQPYYGYPPYHYPYVPPQHYHTHTPYQYSQPSLVAPQPSLVKPLPSLIPSQPSVPLVKPSASPRPTPRTSDGRRR